MALEYKPYLHQQSRSTWLKHLADKAEADKRIRNIVADDLNLKAGIQKQLEQAYSPIVSAQQETTKKLEAIRKLFDIEGEFFKEMEKRGVIQQQMLTQLLHYNERILVHLDRNDIGELRKELKQREQLLNMLPQIYQKLFKEEIQKQEEPLFTGRELKLFEKGENIKPNIKAEPEVGETTYDTFDEPLQSASSASATVSKPIYILPPAYEEVLQDPNNKKFDIEFLKANVLPYYTKFHYPSITKESQLLNKIKELDEERRKIFDEFYAINPRLTMQMSQRPHPPPILGEQFFDQMTNKEMAEQLKRLKDYREGKGVAKPISNKVNSPTALARVHLLLSENSAGNTAGHPEFLNLLKKLKKEKIINNTEYKTFTSKWRAE